VIHTDNAQTIHNNLAQLRKLVTSGMKHDHERDVALSLIDASTKALNDLDEHEKWLQRAYDNDRGHDDD
jgi:hypothetical protein